MEDQEWLGKRASPGNALLSGVVAVVFFAAIAFVTPSDWVLIPVGLSILSALGTILQVITAATERRQDADLARMYPGYRGERVPLFHLLRFEWPHGAEDYEPDKNVLFSLGVAHDSLFVIRNRLGGGTVEELSGGKPLQRPGDYRPVRVSRDGFEVTVQEFDAERIKEASSVSGEERAGEVLASIFTASIVYSTRRPFAALLLLVCRTDTAEAALLFGIPEDVPESLLESLGESKENLDALAKEGARGWKGRLAAQRIADRIRAQRRG